MSAAVVNTKPGKTAEPNKIVYKMEIQLPEGAVYEAPYAGPIQYPPPTVAKDVINDPNKGLQEPPHPEWLAKIHPSKIIKNTKIAQLVPVPLG